MDYENILSRKVQDLQFSGIRKFFDIAASYDDVISLSVGEPDFKTPWAIRKEAIRVLEKDVQTIPQTQDLPTFVLLSTTISMTDCTSAMTLCTRYL